MEEPTHTSVCQRCVSELRASLRSVPRFSPLTRIVKAIPAAVSDITRRTQFWRNSCAECCNGMAFTTQVQNVQLLPKRLSAQSHADMLVVSLFWCGDWARGLFCTPAVSTGEKSLVRSLAIALSFKFLSPKCGCSKTVTYHFCLHGGRSEKKGRKKWNLVNWFNF